MLCGSYWVSKIHLLTRLRLNRQQLRERQGDRERDRDSPASEAAELLNWGRFQAKQARLLPPSPDMFLKRKKTQQMKDCRHKRSINMLFVSRRSS